MFMDKDEWSDDDLDDVDEVVVPMSMVPKPQVLSGGQNLGGQYGGGENRASAYNERMERARNAVQNQRKGSTSGMMMTNTDRPTSARPVGRGAPHIDILAKEVDDMALEEEELEERAQQLDKATKRIERDEEPPPRSGRGGAGTKEKAQPAYASNVDDDDELDISDAQPTYNFGSRNAGGGGSAASANRERDRHDDDDDDDDERDQRGGSSSARGRGFERAKEKGAQNRPPQRERDYEDDERETESRGSVSTSSSMVPSSVPRNVEGSAPAIIDTSNLREFLMRPGPMGAMVQCYIQRRKTGLARLYPTYEVYLKDGEQFLLAARRRKRQKQSTYKVSLDQNDLSRSSSNYFGKLKSNFIGTEFQMYDYGANPSKLTEAQRSGSGAQVRQELATVLYKQNVLGSRGPRKMKVIVPNVDEESNERRVLKPTRMEDTMLEKYKAARDDQDVVILKNKQPKWNEQVGAYVLNFNGRVTRASVKNFQLCIPDRDPDRVVMQFGRVGKDAFTMDYQFPLCGLQAFGIALSSFDYKIACE